MEGDNERATLAAALLKRAKQPLVFRMFDYWLGKRDGRRMPSRRDIDPMDIPWALAKIALVDYDAETGDYRFRIVGNDITEAVGRTNMKGLTLRDLGPLDAIRNVEENWRPLVDGPCVVHVSGFIYFLMNRYPLGERLLLPLSEDDRTLTGALILDVREPHEPGEKPTEEYVNIQAIPLDSLP